MIAVTGASGFVGRTLVGEAAWRGIPVRAVSRRPPSPREGAHAIEVRGLDDLEGLRRGFEGCTAVVHLAARVHVMRESERDPLAAFRAINVEGTRTVLRAAQESGVRRVVYVSTAKVFGEGSNTSLKTDDPTFPEEPYGLSKLEAERLVMARDTFGGEAVVLRPPLVFGRGVGGNFRRLVALARWARVVPLPLGGVTNSRSVVSVQNLADAILHVVAHPQAVGKVFLVADDPPLSTPDLLERIGRAAGWKVRLWKCPERALRIAASLLGAKREADRILGSLTFDASGLNSIGWQPPLTTDDALRLMFERRGAPSPKQSRLCSC